VQRGAVHREGGVSLRQEFRSLEDIVYQQLFQRIVSHQIAPGTRFVLDDVAREFGVSRTPVRDALKRLEADGLVEGSGRVGFATRTIRPQDVHEYFEVRLALELFATEQIVSHATADDIATVRQATYRLHRILSAETLDAAEAMAANSAWQGALISLAANGRLVREYERLTAPATAWALRTWLPLEARRADVDAWLAEWVGFIRALERRDVQAARQSLREHNEAARRRSIELLRQFGLLEEDPDPPSDIGA
jgi:DNA-binding GntR family transcriptional regulator